MGYASTIERFQQFEFQIPASTKPDEILALVAAVNESYAEELAYWFEFKVEDGQFSMEPIDDSAKAYELIDSLKVLIDVINPLQINAERGLQGLRFHFELWGEEPGDAWLYKSDETGILGIEGKMTFTGESVRE